MPIGPKIYAHRGIWQQRFQQNSKLGIEQCYGLDFGVETDFRSLNGDLVISHDPIINSKPLLVSEIQFYNMPVAINIKEDGLVNQYRAFLDKNRNSYSFLFDGSIPEMQKIRKEGLPHALRLSEFETSLSWDTNFIWVDSFFDNWWINNKKIEKYLQTHFVVYVSPEIHQRSHSEAWTYLRNIRDNVSCNFGVCTDLPIELRTFLYETN